MDVRLERVDTVLACGGPRVYCHNMKLQDIEREAHGLNEQERTTLVLSLIETLGAPDAAVSDDEVDQREAEMDSGAVEPILHEEFVRRVQEERGR